MLLDPNKPVLCGERFYSVAEIAEGLDVSEKTLRRWIDSGDLAIHRLGRQIRISEKDLKRFLRDRWSG